MLLLYNLFQVILVIFLWPVWLPIVVLTPKYRGATWRRLGFGLGPLVRKLATGHPRIWLHALSVGEVTSARALVRQLRQEYPAGVLIFSSATRSGRQYAASVLAEQVDLLVPFPLDFWWSAERFIKRLRPDLFVLVETDLWPNFLAALGRHGVPALLVNGRISAESFNKYLGFRWFFAPLFRSFKYIAMQTGADAEKLQRLGVPAGQLLCLGNLKYEVLAGSGNAARRGEPLAPAASGGKRLWVAGSTHPGEETVVFAAYQQLRRIFNDLYLVVAPRNIERGPELVALARRYGLAAVRRTEGAGLHGDLLILDTLGELAALYRSAAVAFVGGSLVMERGHNPLEPAAFATPVIFGPHMEDFAEIAAALLDLGGACQVEDDRAMVRVLKEWLADAQIRQQVGACGARLVAEQQGVTARHVELIRQTIKEGKG